MTSAFWRTLEREIDAAHREADKSDELERRWVALTALPIAHEGDERRDCDVPGCFVCGDKT